LAPPPRALVAVVAQGVAQGVAQVLAAPRRVRLQAVPEVAALLLVQGLVASQSLRSR